MDAAGDAGGICCDASGTATLTQIPKPVECSPIAAHTPRAKESGEDSPSLPLIPSHLSPASPSAIYFTGTSGGGYETLLAAGRNLSVPVY